MTALQEHEPPLVVMGRLREAIHFGGYSLGRIVAELDYLLTDNRWRECGYDRFEDFVAKLQLGSLKTTVEQRKELEKKIRAAGEVSNRKLAAALGVDESTVRADLRPAGNPAPQPAAAKEIEGEIAPPAGNPASAKPQGFTLGHVCVGPRGTFGTGETEWFTPSEYLDRARSVLGAFDLDPASNRIANETVRAARFFSSDDDGLTKQWHGRVWLNPPYAQPAIQHFADKMVAEWQSGRVEAAIMLTHNYTDTAWFQALAHAAAAICFTRGRVRFVAPDGTLAAPTQGQAFFYFGRVAEDFSRVFGDAGFVR